MASADPKPELRLTKTCRFKFAAVRVRPAPCAPFGLVPTLLDPPSPLIPCLPRP